MNSPGSARTRAFGHGALDAMPQHDGRAVAGNLDDVFGGVRARTLEEGDHDLIDGAALLIGELGKRGGPRLPRVLAGKVQDLARRWQPRRRPEIRTTPKPPRPGGVEMATIVSFGFNAADSMQEFQVRQAGIGYPTGLGAPAALHSRTATVSAAHGRAAPSAGSGGGGGASGKLAMPAG